MGQASAVLRRLTGGFSHWCPGCEEMHAIAVDAPNRLGAKWTFDGDVERPTFSPSVNILVRHLDGEPDERCHYFVRAGQIEFLADSTHALAGKTVPLPPLPAHLRDAGVD